MALPKALRYAVLHVGSSSMSITILEYKGIDDVRVIDYAAREVTFGEMGQALNINTGQTIP